MNRIIRYLETHDPPEWAFVAVGVILLVALVLALLS